MARRWQLPILTTAPPSPERGAAETYVLDASAAVEYLLQSDQGERVAAVIDGVRLIAPDLIDAEVMSSLRGLVLRREIDETRALAALSDLAVMPIERIPYHPLLSLAWRYYRNVTSYDALYVALAETYGATVVTVDGHLARAPAGVVGVAVLNVGVG